MDEGFPDQDKDGVKDCADGDADGDGVLDEVDNCPVDANEDQADLDGDEIGDLCDVDADGDAIPDPNDNCPAYTPPPYPISRGQVLTVLPFGNVVVTPHISGPSTPDEIAPIFNDNLRRYLAGRTLRYAVDRKRGY